MRFTMTLVLLLSTAVMYAQDAEKTMLASDGKTQITVPGHWTELELNDVAEIELGNADDPAYLIVINELKEDLFGWNIEKHSRVTLGGLLGTLAFPTVEGPRAIKVGGSPAIQYEVSGALEGQKIVYIHTTVDGPNYLSQILAWSIPSQVDKIRPQLIKAVSTFREAKGSQ